MAPCLCRSKFTTMRVCIQHAPFHIYTILRTWGISACVSTLGFDEATVVNLMGGRVHLNMDFRGCCRCPIGLLNQLSGSGACGCGRLPTTVGSKTRSNQNLTLPRQRNDHVGSEGRRGLPARCSPTQPPSGLPPLHLWRTTLKWKHFDNTHTACFCTDLYSKPIDNLGGLNHFRMELQSLTAMLRFSVQ